MYGQLEGVVTELTHTRLSPNNPHFQFIGSDKEDQKLIQIGDHEKPAYWVRSR